LYFGQANTYLIDPSVMALSPPAAIGIALAFLIAGWLIYDALCRLFFGRDERVLGSMLAVLLSIAAFALCHLFSGRGAYILFGAMIGTIMVANVFFVIIPGQREMVKAKAEGRALDPVYGIRGKQRSVHNTYFTLPVLFVMISNHYALTYGAQWNWLVLIAMAFAGASIRAWFVARHKAHERGGQTSKAPLAIGLVTLAGVAFALAPTPRTSARSASNPAQTAQQFADVQSIIQQRCVPCHQPSPNFAGFSAAPKGVLLDTPEHILANTAQMQTQLSTRVMPIGNLTQMTDAERATVLAWLGDGAPH
jgi:uncharacterized membrane protein